MNSNVPRREAFSYNTNVIDCLDSGVFVIDKNFTVHLWNRFMAIHSDYSETDIIGSNLLEHFSELASTWFKRKVNSVFLLNHQSYTSWEHRPYLFKFSNGRSVTGGLDHMYQNCCFTPICDENNNVQYVCITIKDVTDTAMSTMRLKKAYAELERISNIDGLTQLFSRTYWEQRFVSEVERINRYGGDVSVIIFDIDHFKQINDQHGHLCGDEVLRQVSKRCSSALRSVDVIGRYGGEEFTIFLPETSIELTKIVAEKLRKIICDQPFYYDSKELFISISVGLSCSSDSRKNHFEKLLNQADMALYEAKINGRNQCISYFDSALDRSE
ncbi:diguanylate cyclase [Vibrio sp. TH_r3]|uniref:sensor domain-containing diguanylate cyclase n=1 Tax=Vibrio sp. TH_r3 TaxID=3082084 RepID=UPI002954FEA1|nr:diguanylate cyclase [Vibrio sp. TH_r3]MDV7105905.1 diguanylate cyclase [Vibrio sp. TH_r3]